MKRLAMFFCTGWIVTFGRLVVNPFPTMRIVEIVSRRHVINMLSCLTDSTEFMIFNKLRG